METLQIILTISLLVTSLALTCVLIYLVLTLKEAKETIREAKEILKTARKVTSSVAFPITTVMGVIGGLSKGLKAVRSISSIFDNEEYDEDEDEGYEED